MNYRSKFPGERLGVLAIRDFRLFYAGYSASLLGTAMSSVAIAFAVLGSGGTPTGLGVVFTANIVPMVAFTLGGGALADRFGRRPVMLAADVARCLAQGGLAVALSLGHPRLWLFVAAALVVGTGNAFFQPALSGLPVEFAPRDRLGDVNALLAAAQPAAQIAGPALAGILIAATSPAAAVAADAASYAASAIALAMLRFPGTRSAGPERPASRSLLRDLADGWAEFAARDWIWVPTVQFALFNLFTWGPYLVLGPVLARDYLGGARAWGAILACYGGGAILGGLLALGRRPRRPLALANLATLGFPLPPLALALHLPAAAVAAGALLAGLGSGARQRARGDRGAAAAAAAGAVPRGCVQHGRRVRVRPRRVHRRGPGGGRGRRPRRARLRRGLGRPRHARRLRRALRPPHALAGNHDEPAGARTGTVSPPVRHAGLPASRAPATGCRRSAHGRRPGGRRGRRSR